MYKEDNNKEEKFNNEYKEEKIMDITSIEVGEDATKYGEFVSSYFAWIDLEEQKNKVKKIEKMTDKKRKR